MQNDCTYYKARAPLLGDMRCGYWAVPHPRNITQFMPHCTHRQVFEVEECPMSIKTDS